MGGGTNECGPKQGKVKICSIKSEWNESQNQEFAFFRRIDSSFLAQSGGNIGVFVSFTGLDM